MVEGKKKKVTYVIHEDILKMLLEISNVSRRSMVKEIEFLIEQKFKGLDPDDISDEFFESIG